MSEKNKKTQLKILYKFIGLIFYIGSLVGLLSAFIILLIIIQGKLLDFTSILLGIGGLIISALYFLGFILAGRILFRKGNSKNEIV